MASSFRAQALFRLAVSLFAALDAAGFAHPFPGRDWLAAVAGFEARAGAKGTLIGPFGFEDLGIAVLGIRQHTNLEVAARLGFMQQTNFQRAAGFAPDVRAETPALVVVGAVLLC